MTTVKIEAGCSKVKGMENSWRYDYTDVHGIHTIVFQTTEVPEIGDFLDDGVFRRRDGPQVNPDTSKWTKKYRKIWGEG